MIIRTPRYPPIAASNKPPSGRSRMAHAMASPHQTQRTRRRVCQSLNSRTAKFNARVVKKISSVSVSAAAAKFAKNGHNAAKKMQFWQHDQKTSGGQCLQPGSMKQDQQISESPAQPGSAPSRK